MAAVIKGNIVASRKLVNQEIWLSPLKKMSSAWGNTEYAFNTVQSPLRLIVLFSSYISAQEIVLFYFKKKNF